MYLPLLVMVAKSIVAFATITIGCEKVNYMIPSYEYGIWTQIIWQFQKYEIHLFPNVSNCCQGKLYFETMNNG